ncbi:MAG: hypothetical protein IJ745_07895, partial [Bacteroidales bacterium]|nr:hypothetical protein [Bacteroidales bacterium]
HPYPADYVCSVEMTFRRTVKVRFNERFGLGSLTLCAGEEEVWMKDARETGCRIIYVAIPMVRTPAVTTGENFLENKKLQMTKWATFRYVYGTSNAMWRTVKEAGWWGRRWQARTWGGRGNGGCVPNRVHCGKIYCMFSFFFIGERKKNVSLW